MTPIGRRDRCALGRSKSHRRRTDDLVGKLEVRGLFSWGISRKEENKHSSRTGGETMEDNNQSSMIHASHHHFLGLKSQSNRDGPRCASRRACTGNYRTGNSPQGGHPCFGKTAQTYRTRHDRNAKPQTQEGLTPDLNKRQTCRASARKRLAHAGCETYQWR